MPSIVILIYPDEAIFALLLYSGKNCFKNLRVKFGTKIKSASKKL